MSKGQAILLILLLSLALLTIIFGLVRSIRHALCWLSDHEKKRPHLHRRSFLMAKCYYAFAMIAFVVGG
jgi:hypothetical protein